MHDNAITEAIWYLVTYNRNNYAGTDSVTVFEHADGTRGWTDGLDLPSAVTDATIILQAYLDENGDVTTVK